MKKSVLVFLLAAVAAAVTGGAWYTGQQLEPVIDGVIADINAELERQLPGNNVRLERLSLTRGIFSSTVQYQLELGELAEDLPSSAVVIVDHLEHGPLPWSRLSRFEWWPVAAYSQARLESNALTATLFDMAQGAEPITVRSALKYDRSFDIDVSVPALQHADAQTTFTFSGFNGAFQGTVDSIRGHGEAALLTLTALGPQPAQVRLQGMRVDLDRARGETGLSLGEQSAGVARLELQLPDMERLTLDRIDLRDRISQQADRVSAEFASRIEQLSYGGKAVGAVRLDWSVRDLDAAASRQLLDVLASLDDDADAPLPGSLQEQQLQQALRALLVKGPTVSLDQLALHTATGESRLSIAAVLREPLQEPVLTVEQAILEYLSSLDVQLDVGLDSIRDLAAYHAQFDPNLDSAQAALDASMLAQMAGSTVVGMGLASLDGNTLETRLSYANGEVTFNGTTQPLGDFLLMLGMLMRAQYQ